MGCALISMRPCCIAVFLDFMNFEANMFAVIKSGGKQYRVAKNDIITVEKLLGEPGDTIALDTVLMLGEDGKAPTVGAPLVDKAAVFAEVVEQSRADKIIVFKSSGVRTTAARTVIANNRPYCASLRLAPLAPSRKQRPKRQPQKRRLIKMINRQSKKQHQRKQHPKRQHLTRMPNLWRKRKRR